MSLLHLSTLLSILGLTGFAMASSRPQSNWLGTIKWFSIGRKNFILKFNIRFTWKMLTYRKRFIGALQKCVQIGASTLCNFLAVRFRAKRQVAQTFSGQHLCFSFCSCQRKITRLHSMNMMRYNEIYLSIL